MCSATVKQYYRVDRRQIHFLKFILEGYDGMAVVRTLDPPQGLVVLHIGPGCQSVVDMIVRDLRKQIRIEPVELTIEQSQSKGDNATRDLNHHFAFPGLSGPGEESP